MGEARVNRRSRVVHHICQYRRTNIADGSIDDFGIILPYLDIASDAFVMVKPNFYLKRNSREIPGKEKLKHSVLLLRLQVFVSDEFWHPSLLSRLTDCLLDIGA